jgi:predicted SnoaL-like aldol condensation-catalyzing enzyme
LQSPLTTFYAKPQEGKPDPENKALALLAHQYMGRGSRSDAARVGPGLQLSLFCSKPQEAVEDVLDLGIGETFMKQRVTFIGLGLAVALAGAAFLSAQDPVVGSNGPESLFTSPDPKLHRNKQAAMHIMRDLLEAGHWDEAPKWLTERYIQHNPCCANGRQTVMTFFGGRGTPRPIPDKNGWQTKIVSVVAEGDYVTVAVLRTCADPRKPGNTYTTTWFDMWRFVDGKADEHWDFGTIAAAGDTPDCARVAAPAPAGGPGAPPPARGR